MAIEDDFKQAMQAAGVEPGASVVADGALHRFQVEGDRPGSKNGWYVLHGDDPAAGQFGCFKRGISETWCAKAYQTLSAEEKARYKANMETVKSQRAWELSRLQGDCRTWCAERWKQSKDATDSHQYLQIKGVHAYGLKMMKDSLLIPLYDTAGIIQGIQFIQPDGSKTFKTGTAKQGNYFPIGKPKENTLLICEGYATGASLHEATGHAVAVAFDAGNLKPVAEALRLKYPALRLIICADNDQWGETNTGVIKGTEAARAVDGWLTIANIRDTSSKPTDFNDLHKLEGLEEIRRQIETATASPISSDKVVPETVKPSVNDSAEPLPLTRPMQPNEPFPVDSLPLVMRAAVLRVHEVVQAPLDMICQSFLAAATLAVQPYANVLIDGRCFPLSNNFVAVGESGERKSATDRIATGPIKERQRRESESFHQGKQAYEAALASWQNRRKAAFKEDDQDVIKALLQQLGDEPRYVQPFYIFEEPSFEGIERAYAEGRYTLGLFSDEGGRFLGGYAMSKDNQTKTVTGLSKLWDGDPIDRVRGGDGLSVLYGRRFAMHLMIQPILCGQLFGNSMMTGQGFLSRCLCSYPASTIGWRPYKAQDLSADPAITAYNAAINGILDKLLPLNERPDMGLKPPAITIAKDAKGTWIAFADHIELLQREGGDLFPIKGFASKAAEHAARIAGVLALFETPDATEISADALNGGIAIAQYYIGEALRLFHSASDDQELITAQKVFDWGMQQEGQMIALAELYRCGPNAVRDKKTANRMMDILEQHHRALRIEGGAQVNGKPRRDVWLLRG
jgi:putative DNA primase/helicase